MTLASAEPLADLAGKPDWASANEAIIDLGLAWIDQRLAGEEGTREQRDYLEARAALNATGRPSALDRLGTAFRLSPFEEDVLLIALAPGLDGSFGPRFGAAQGRLTSARATPHLIARLLFGGERLPFAALQGLVATGSLRRFALIGLDDREPLAQAGISLPDRVANLLCGFETPDPLVDGFARRRHIVPLPDRLEALATRVSLQTLAPLRLQLIGQLRSGRTELAAAIMARLGLGCIEIAGDVRTAAERASLARECVLDQCGVVIADSGDGIDADTLRALDALIPGPLLIVGSQTVPDFESIPLIRLDPLDATERHALWTKAAPDADKMLLSGIAEQFALGPSEIAAIAEHDHRGEAIWPACRELGARDLDALATRVVPERGWAEMVLTAETLAELNALASQVARRAEVHHDWGYRRVLGRATGISVLFAGPSGVGKTMAAEAIAKALSLDLYVVDLARVTSKYIGETEKNLRRIFDAAEAGGCVLFFDEADALFGKRSEVKDSHDRYANAEISYLLQRMESFSGLAILATNLKSHLDTAFLRRIRAIVDFPIPDAEMRLALWRRALPETAPQAGIDFAGLARHELTGGNITTIATNAAFRASADGVPIGMAHLAVAMSSEFRKLDRDPSGLGR
jgi:ATPase family associated with various cellular activities (AAA)